MYQSYTQKKIDQLIKQEVKDCQKKNPYYEMQYDSHVLAVTHDDDEYDSTRILITLHGVPKPDAPKGERKVIHEFVTEIYL